jgi:putative ABC transport system permease protein
LDGIARRILGEHPGEITGRGASLFSLAEWGTRRSRTTLLVLFAAVGCVLLITCVNIANLLLARGSQRRREVAVRTALGAGRGRILRQLLTESTLLAVLGAGLGLLLAYSLTSFLGARASILLNQFDIDTSAEIRLDRWVFLFTAGVAVLAGLGTGVFPAWQLVQSSLTGRLKEGGRSGTPTRSHQHFRNVLVMTEVALSLVLLVTAGLLLRSFDELRRVHSGARADHLLTAGVSLPKARYAKREQVAAFSQQLLGRLDALPGVRSAGLVSCLPAAGYCRDGAFNIEGRPLPPGQFNVALDRDASPGYFTSAGIPLLRGRTFTAQDGRGFDDQHPRESAVVISESMAREFWPNLDALGQRIYFGPAGSARYQIVGIVGDVLTHMDGKPQPTMYLPLLEGARTDFYAAVHTIGDPAALAPAVRREISGLDPDIPAYRIRTMSNILGQSAAQRQFTALLLGLFAALALVLAAIGLYGVLSYSVAQRTSEIGIRMALGATQRRIWRLVLVDGMQPALLGAVLGLIGAIGASRFLQSLLFGVSQNDLVTFVSVPVVLLLVALLACSFPAWRATGVEPAAALRSE